MEKTTVCSRKSILKKTKKLIGKKTKKRCQDDDYREKLSSSIKRGMEKSNASEKLKGERVKRVTTECAYCGKVLTMLPSEYKERSERNIDGQIFCSMSCSAKLNNPSKNKIVAKDDIVKWGVEYLEEIKELPTYNGWDVWKEKHPEVCSRECIRKNFNGFSDFKNEIIAASLPSNHKIVSVESDGFEDVFNITVDEFHTVAYITNPTARTRKLGYPKMWGLYTANCGEQSLHKQGSCCLGSINLTKFFDKDTKDFRYMEFQEAIRTATCFLDFMISVSGYPTEDYKIVAEKTRPIGLGIMGLADLLCLMKLPYDSAEAREFTQNIFKTLTQESILASIDLGHKYGSFPAFKDAANKMNQLVDKFMPLDEEIDAIRNSQWTTVAPTGSISISTDCSPGMEPLFGICYTKRLSDSDEKWIFVNPIFEEKFKEEPWYQEGIEKIAENHGSCQGIDCIPENVQKVWKVAHDIGWKDRLLMQSKIQEYISAAISSTVNLPEKATVEEIKEIYLEAYKLDLKGITVYRDGCLQNQPVAFGEENQPIAEEVKKLKTRPKILSGNTHLVETGHGKIYLTVNRDDENNVYELFTNGGKNGGVSSANLEAIARLSSLALQEGVTVKNIANTLARINDGTCVWDKLHDNDSRSQQIVSIPDAVAQILNRFYCNGKDPKDKDAGVKSSYCEDCGSEMFLKEGCSFCPECGSKCG